MTDSEEILTAAHVRTLRQSILPLPSAMAASVLRRPVLRLRGWPEAVDGVRAPPHAWCRRCISS